MVRGGRDLFSKLPAAFKGVKQAIKKSRKNAKIVDATWNAL